MSKLGLRLKQERTRLGLSQGVFAKHGGVTLNTQFNYEAGIRSPDVEYLLKIADSGADPVYVLTGQIITEYVQGEELELLSGFRSMDATGRAGLLGFVRGVLEKQLNSTEEEKRADVPANKTKGAKATAPKRRAAGKGKPG